MTPRPTRPSAARIAKLARTTLVGAALTAVACTLVPPAAADPEDPPTTVAEAQALVKELKHESAAFDQKYVEAKEKYAKAEKALAAKQKDLKAQRAKLAELKEAVAAIALAQYQSRGIDTTTKLIVSSSPDGLLRDLSLQERMNQRQRTTVQNYQTELANQADLERAAEADKAEMKAASKAMEQARDDAKAKLSEAEQILQRLTEEQRRRIEEQRRREAEEARRRAEAAQQQANSNDSDNGADNDGDSEGSEARTTSASRSEERSEPKAPPASGRAGAAVAAAVAKLGAPYQYGGTGPGYDCSGLTSTSWAAAGVSIGRTTYAQWGNGRPISRGELQPGDLVFYYGLGHVAMYVGNGTVIHAPTYGQSVKYASIDSMPLTGYRRVG